MQNMFERLNNGEILKVSINDGDLGCADVQDAFEEFGFVYLRQTEQGDFCIDTDDENLLFVEDRNYISMIVKNVLN